MKLRFRGLASGHLTRWIFIQLTLAELMLLSSLTFAYDLGFTKRRSGDKSQTRWTITDYLTQKNRVALMDSWLAMNRQVSPFELIIGGGPISYSYTVDDNAGDRVVTTQSAVNYRLAFFVSIFGLEGEYEKTDNNWEAWSANLGIRLLGTANQGTNLTVKYGYRETKDTSLTPPSIWHNQFAEASLGLYIVDFLGLSGSYRYYFPDRGSTGVDLSGHRSSAGLFLEYRFLRAYAEYFQERFKYNNSGSVTDRNRDGIEYGARFYF